jgi:predicted Rdx family selenoprotein
VANSVIVVRVLRRGGRADELLEQLGGALDREALMPDEYGAVRLRIDARGPVAWTTVRDALDGLGSDWRQWLHLAPRPTR